MKSNKKQKKAGGQPAKEMKTKSSTNLTNDFHILKSQAVPIGLRTTPRDQLKDTITVEQFFEGVRSGKWKAEVEAVRKFDKDDPKYDAAKKKAPAVWLQHLDVLVFDYDKGVLEVPEEFVLARFKSVGDNGYAVILLTPPGEDRKTYRRKLQKKYKFQDGQIADDRCRHVSFDPTIKINWGCRVDTDVPELTKEDDKQYSESIWKEQLESGEVLDNTARLSVYSGLRCEGKSTDEVLKQFLDMLKAGRFKAKTTDKHIRTECSKWEDRYTYPIPIKLGKTRATSTPTTPTSNYESVKIDPATYLKPEHISKLIAQCSVSPFMNISIEWYFDEEISNCASSALLIGEPATGKGIIDKYTVKLFDDLIEFNKRVAAKLSSTTEFKKLSSKDQAARVPNITSLAGPDTTKESLIESLSCGVPTLYTSTELDSIIASSTHDYNRGALALFRRLISGETFAKTIKKTAGKETTFNIKKPVFAMVASGTNSSNNFLSKNIDNGFVSRFLFMQTDPDVGSMKTIDIKLPVNTLMERYGKEPGLIKYDDKIVKEFLNDHLNSNHKESRQFIIRGVKDCVKRAAVQAKLDAYEIVDKDELQFQFEAFEKSLKFQSQLFLHERNNFGQSMAMDKIKDRINIETGKSFKTNTGLALDTKTIEKIMTLKSEGGSLRSIAKLLGLSPNTIKKY